jgi:hypothetical protein
MEKISFKNFEEIEDTNLMSKNNIMISDGIPKAKEIDLISSFNDSGFLIDNENENENYINNDINNDNENDINNNFMEQNFFIKNNFIEKKDEHLKMINKIKENNLLFRENEELKSKLKIISNNSQKLLKIFGSSQKPKLRYLIN